MRYFAAVLATAAVVSAANESLSTYIPSCAVDCLTTAIGAATKCAGPDDLECFCIAENYRAIYDSGVACVLQACGNDVSVGEVLPAAAKMCEEVVARSGKPVTSVGWPTNTAAPEPTTTEANPETATTSANADVKLSPYVLGVVAPIVVAAAAHL